MANAPERAPPTLRPDAPLPLGVEEGAEVPEAPVGELESDALESALLWLALADEAADETADEALELAVARAPVAELNAELASVAVGTAAESVAV